MTEITENIVNKWEKTGLLWGLGGLTEISDKKNIALLLENQANWIKNTYKIPREIPHWVLLPLVRETFVDRSFQIRATDKPPSNPNYLCLNTVINEKDYPGASYPAEVSNYIEVLSDNIIETLNVCYQSSLLTKKERVYIPLHLEELPDKDQGYKQWLLYLIYSNKYNIKRT